MMSHWAARTHSRWHHHQMSNFLGELNSYPPANGPLMEGLVLSDDLSRLEQNSCETIQQIFPESSTCLIDDGK